jgi:thiosulfate reductase cytochrome b subunit
MKILHDHRVKIASARAALLFCIFFLIACGLGYPVLNRFDPRQTPGLSDVKTYASLVTGTASPDAEDMRFRRFRVLVPWLA